MTVFGKTSLAQILAEETGLLRGFLDILAQEHELLLAGETAALPAVAAAKTDLATALARTEATRRACSAARPGGENSPAWQELRELGERAARANLENGVILAALTRHVEGALRIFTGAEEPIYGPAGNQAKSPGSRPLASA